MEPYQAKGYMFEGIVAQLLRNSGYIWDENIEESDQLQGRGSKHQIDAFGIADYIHPFISKIRLLAECKYKTDNVDDAVGIEVVRNMLGVLQDISQNYFSENFEIAEQILFRRHTDSGVIFTNSYFTKPAVSYGFAHNIFLVSYYGNPVMANIIDAFERFCSHIDFRRIKTKEESRLLMRKILRGEYSHDYRGLKSHLKSITEPMLFHDDAQKFSSIVNGTHSIMAFINGSYPIHIFSKNNVHLPQYLLDADRLRDQSIEVGYMYEWIESHESVVFKFKTGFDSEVFYFTLPAHIFSEEKLRSKDLIYEKNRFLKNVVVPIVLERRIIGQINLKFNEEYIDSDWNHE